MGYELEAFLVPLSVKNKPAVVYPLTDAIGLVPLTLSVESSMIENWAEAASRGTKIARISAGYFGGMGSQSATVWSEGKIVAEEVDVNEALRRLGVEAEAGQDEWDTVGLGRFRRTATWAAQAIRKARMEGPNPIPELLEALSYTCVDAEQQQKVRSGAAQDLGTLRVQEAIPHLVQAVKARSESGFRISAAAALARIGGAGITELAKMLDEREPMYRRRRDPHRFFPIVHALGEAGEAAAPVAAELAKMLAHWYVGVRIDTANAFAKIGPSAAAAIPALKVALEDEDRLVRSAAQEALRVVDPTLDVDSSTAGRA